jgi:hypothetical protein
LIGSNDSLFCWIKRHWPNLDGTSPSQGWLACDDGSMEIADFIHLDTNTDKGSPLLSLIHVKGSHSKEPDRAISVSDYEVVTAQAQKNLRFLDRLLLQKGLDQGIGKRNWKLVWHNGIEQPDRRGILAALRKVRTNYKRQVVIVQPRLSRSILEDVRAEKESKDNKKRSKPAGRVVRLMQLETMLVGAQNACRAMGAEFLVIVDGTPLPARPVSTRRTPRSRTPRGGTR